MQFPTLPTSFLQNDTTQQNNATQQLLKQLVDCHTETNKKIDQIIEVLKCNAQGGASGGGATFCTYSNAAQEIEQRD